MKDKIKISVDKNNNMIYYNNQIAKKGAIRMEKETVLQMVKRVKEYAEGKIKDGEKYNDNLPFQAGYYESSIKALIDMLDFIEKRDLQELDKMADELGGNNDYSRI